MNFVRNIPSKYILLTIVILGFLLRVNNLTIGFPSLFISNDEAIYHQSALNMLAEKTPFTIGNYGPLGAYIQIPLILLAFVMFFITGKAHSVADMEFLLVTQEGYLLFIPRIISATFGTLSILVIYKLARELFNDKRAALLASLLFAVSFNLVLVSHLARAWSPAIFFSLLAVLFAIKSIKGTSQEFKNTLLAFVLAALAFGFHQIAGVVIILVLLIKILSKKSYSFGAIFSRVNLIALGVWFLLILVFNYLSLGSEFFEVVSPTNPSVGLLKIPSKLTTIADFVNYYLRSGSMEKVIKDLILTDGLTAVCAFLFFLKKQNRTRITLAFLIFITLNLLLIATIFPPFQRYALVAIAFLPIFAAVFLEASLPKGKIAPVGILVILILASFNSIYWNLLILKKPTFDQIRKWLDDNVGVEVPIAVTARRNFGYVPVKSASEPIRKFNPGYYLRAAKLAGDSYPANVRNVIYIDQFGGKSKTENLNKSLAVYHVAYVIDSYLGSYDRLYTHYDGARLELLAHFSPTGDKIYNKKIPELLFDAPYVFPLFVLDRAGPYFDVLKVDGGVRP